ncbi:MAG TPA: hypothetical protein VK957_17115 [Lunatimonas sp.]|nr:hypothetical protein [Lunatimonas sp.]
MVRVFMFFTGVCLLPIFGWTQDFSVGFIGRTNFTLNRFNESLDRAVIPEVTLIGLYRLPYLQPLDLGLSLGYSLYGTDMEKRDDLFPDSSETFRLRKYHNLWNLKAHLRFYPSRSIHFPLFFEVQGGAVNINTRYAIRDGAFDEPLEKDGIIRDWVMGYGAGMGYKFPFSKDPTRGHIEIRLLYHDSAFAKFIRKGQAQFDADIGEFGQFVYQPHRAPLTMLELSIGIFMANLGI